MQSDVPPTPAGLSGRLGSFNAWRVTTKISLSFASTAAAGGGGSGGEGGRLAIEADKHIQLPDKAAGVARIRCQGSGFKFQVWGFSCPCGFLMSVWQNPRWRFGLVLFGAAQASLTFRVSVDRMPCKMTQEPCKNHARTRKSDARVRQTCE